MLKKRIDIIIAAAVIVVLLLGSMMYMSGRRNAIESMKQEIEGLQRSRPSGSQRSASDQELSKLFPAKPDLPAFVDSLYIFANTAGVKGLEVQTVKGPDISDRAPRKPAEKTRSLRSFSFKITMEGNYRSIAEYMRLMQNNERFVRLQEIEIWPDKHALKASLQIEVYSAGGPDA